MPLKQHWMILKIPQKKFWKMLLTTLKSPFNILLKQPWAQVFQTPSTQPGYIPNPSRHLPDTLKNFQTPSKHLLHPHSRHLTDSNYFACVILGCFLKIQNQCQVTWVLLRILIIYRIIEDNIQMKGNTMLLNIIF